MNGTDVANRLARHLCLPRLMLLVLLTLGVAGMHTLGHADSPAHMNTPLPAHGHNEAAMEFVAISEESPAAATPDDPTDHGLLILAFTVCLAVMGAGVILLLKPSVTRLRGAGRTFYLAGRSITWRSGRGPPARRLGLRLAEVSVLRL